MAQTDSKTSSGQEQPQTAQNVPYPAPYPQQFEDDTIDLYELWNTLWNRKGLVIAVTIAATLASVIYALVQPPVYKAQALLLPPGAKDIQSLNIPGAKGVNPESVFSKFKQNLSSRTLQKKFILEKGLMELLVPERTPETRDEDIYAGFAELIELDAVNGSTSVSIELHDAEIASQWVNDLINFTDTETIRLMVENISSSTANQIKDIEYSIESKRQMAKQRREDQIEELEYTIASKRDMAKQRREDQIEEIEYSIASKRNMASRRRKDTIKRYEEAAKTAKSLGIMTGLTQQTKSVESSDRVLSAKERNNFASSSPIAQMNVDIATATTPLFFIGYDALNAELDSLKFRTDDDPFIPGLRDLQENLYRLRSIKSDDPFISGLRDLQENLNRLRSIKLDDPFISGLRDLQEQLALLRSIKINEEGLRAVNIDQAAYPPKGRIKPNRRLIVSLGTVMGLFAGIFLAFFIEFVRNQRKKHSDELTAA